MLIARSRTAGLARRLRSTRLPQQTRTYAESHDHGHDDHSHGHGHAAPVDESLGTGFYLAVGAIPAFILVYKLSRPSEDGEAPYFTKLMRKYSDYAQTWEERNTARTAVFEQAALDKHLFYNAGRNRHIELAYPEAFTAGSARNVPAGHYINLDKVVDHYRQQHLDEEDRKAKKMSAKAAEAEK